MTLDSFISLISPYAFLLLIVGALVDIVQAFWIFKKFYRKTRRMIYNHVKKEILEEMRKIDQKG